MYKQSLQFPITEGYKLKVQSCLCVNTCTFHATPYSIMSSVFWYTSSPPAHTVSHSLPLFPLQQSTPANANVSHLSSMHGDTTASERSEVTLQTIAQSSSTGNLKTTPTSTQMSPLSEQPQSVMKRLSVDIHRQSIEKTPHDGMTTFSSFLPHEVSSMVFALLFAVQMMSTPKKPGRKRGLEGEKCHSMHLCVCMCVCVLYIHIHVYMCVRWKYCATVGLKAMYTWIPYY